MSAAPLLFLSGAAALVYQLLWVKQLGLLVGVDVHAVAIGISAFFAGLALGGAVFGRLVERVAAPWRLYAALECGVAATGVLATVLLSTSALLFAVLEASGGMIAWTLPFALVGVPAFLMGGTIPVVMRAVAPGADRIGRTGGALYAFNTAGAIGGALLTPFLLIPMLGVRGSATAAATINLVLAAWALGLARSLGGSEGGSKDPPLQRMKPASSRRGGSLDPPETQRMEPALSRRGGSLDPPETQRMKPALSRRGGSADPPETQRMKPASSRRGGSSDPPETQRMEPALSRRGGSSDPPTSQDPRDGRSGANVALALYAVAGGLALGYEVVWSQILVQLTSTRSFAFAIVLATYLTGLALGSAVYARAADRVRNPWGAFGVLIAGAGLTSLLLVAGLGPWLMSLQSEAEETMRAWTGSELAAMCTRFAIGSLQIVFIPTLLLGAAFPAVLRLAAGPGRIGRDVGVVLALNTVGGIVGTLVTGFLLVPAFGLIRSLGMLAIGAAAVGLVAASRGHAMSASGRLVTAAIAVATMAAAVLVPRDQLARLLPATRGGGTVLFHEESRGGTVSVVEQSSGANRFRRLYVQGVSNSGDAMPSLRYMRLQALLPLLIHRGEPRSALVIGFGTGITAGALLRYPGLDRRVCAELLPGVVHAAPLFRGSFGAATDPRLELRLRDGRRELLASPDRYDLITLEPPPPSAAGVVNLYSRDFYELAAARLEPYGLVAQWWPLPTQTADDSRSLARSFLDAFPHVSVWTTELHEMLLIGSREPLELDAARVAQRFAHPDVKYALGEVGVASPTALLATWVADRPALERFAGAALPVTDDDPRIEYATWVRPDEIVRVLPELLGLQTDPPFKYDDAELRARVADRRRSLHRFYEAGLSAYSRDYDRWAHTITDVMRDEGDNPYYRWSTR